MIFTETKLKALRGFLFIGLLFLSSWSIADTYNATVAYTQSGKPTNTGTSVNAVATAGCESYGGGTILSSAVQVAPDQWNVSCKFSSGTILQLFSVMKSYSCPNGGTVSGELCINVQPCEEPLTRNSTSGICECPAGKSLIEGQCKTLCPSGYHRFTPDDGRCEKDCIGNQFQDASGVCKCSPTKNQIYATTSDSASSPGCDGGCKTTSFLGTLYCPKSNAPLVTTGALPAGLSCYGYGGRTGETCEPSQPPRVDVKLAPLPPPAPVPPPTPPTQENPNPAPPDPKETADNNKDPVACGAAGGTYMVVNGAGKCGTPGPDNGMEGVKKKKVEIVINNPDGSKTTETETTEQRIDPGTGQTTTKKKKVTETKDASGNVISSGSADSSSQSGTKEGEGGGQCEKEPNSPMCKKGKVADKTGKFDGRDEEIAAAKAELTAVFTKIQTQASAMFSPAASGGGSLPCPPPFEVMGRSISLCMTNYTGSVSVIGLVVYLCAAIAAALIIFKR